MTEEQKQATPKRSFVSEKDAPPVAQPQQNVPLEKKLLPPEVALTLIYNQSKIEVELLTEIRDILRGRVSSQVPDAVHAVQTGPATPVQQVAPAPQVAPTVEPPYVKKIKEAFKDVDETLLNFDMDSNTMFVIIKPKQFLGAENFAKIASIVRSFGKDGQYVSEGRNSHFKISKAVGQ